MLPFSDNRFPIYLAPMAGVTDVIFRQICKDLGADVMVTEFVSAEGIMQADERTRKYTEFTDAQRPVGVQLFGADGGRMGEAARKIIDWKQPDFIDINFGCPVNKVVARNGGSSLLKDCPVLASVAAGVVKAVGGQVPVTAKIRIGWDEESINAVEVARILEDSGVQAIAVHGRTRAQSYGGEANWDVIDAVARGVKIPVIGNGDITCGADVARRRRETAVSGVMIGRAAMQNPWVFREARHFLETGEILPETRPDERWELVIRHCTLAIESHRNGNEKQTLTAMRSRLMAYCKGFSGAKELRQKLCHVISLAEVEDLAAESLAKVEMAEVVICEIDEMIPVEKRVSEAPTVPGQPIFFAMMRFFCCSTLALLWGILTVACDQAASATAKKDASTASVDGPISFNTSIQPILSDNCYHCHGPDSGTRLPEKEPLRLDREKFAFAPREDGKPVIIKGDAGASLLVRLIKSKDPDEIMPPPKSHKTLTQQQIATIERWVAEGAVFQEHWSFIPPVKPPLPTLAHPEIVRNPVDVFVAAKLAEQGLDLMPAEDPRVLIRRASLDLTGLLPAAADVEAFATAPSDAAYNAYLDKLFASPAYAEHRTRYWLDYSRYADTHGLHFDNFRSIWPYRDYVIRSFAANKPYDQFVREQLAGDLIPAPTADTWIATGYIRCNVSTNEGGTIPEEVQANNTRDRVEAFGAAFIGLTVQCAACHDHKFDPTAQKDFYSLAAFFNNTAEKPWDQNIADSQPILRLPPDDKRSALDALVAKRSEAAMAFEKRRAGAAQLMRDWMAAGNKPTNVSNDKLDLRLRLDEGSGNVVKNSSNNLNKTSYKADTNPLVWGEDVWLWPSARMDISTNLPMADQGDFESDQPFSGSMWTLLRLKPADVATGNGSLISRMGDKNMESHRGWDMFIDDDKFAVHIISKWPENAMRVDTGGIPRGEWVHLGFSYDGSGHAEGIKLFVNGEERAPHIHTNTLQPGQSIRNKLPLQLGQRDQGSDRLRESAFQDVRVYHRALDPAEFARLPFEDLASEIVAASPDPAKWSARERFIALDRFFLSKVDPEAIRLREEIAATDREIDALGKGGTPTLIAREREAPATAWVLNRGVYSSRKELVEPATPEFLPEAHEATNRLQLAEWLFKPQNPLFARVTVNRIWQEVFGTGIVETSDDFGIMGSRPVNQDLLDWLAVEFRESGWNVQHLYRLLLTSATYRQSNHVTPAALAADPQNRLLSRGPRFRMDAEVLRDTALQAAGLLVAKIGGPPVKPYQPAGVWEAVSMPESDTLKYKRDDGESLYRRSLYTFWKRFSPPPSLETFDAQARENVCMRRARTNTPLQALVSMNDPQFVEAARKLAERAIAAGETTAERMAFLSEALLSRPLTSKESTNLESNLGVYSKYYQEHPQDAKDLLSTGAAAARTDIDPLELASWAMMANQFLNLDEVITK